MSVFARLLEHVEREGKAALVTLSRVEGSTPRGTDAWMIVTPSGGFIGTIGGGALEWDVLAKAGQALTQGVMALPFSHLLGPDLGQCCGGRVKGLIEVFERQDADLLRALAEAEVDPSRRIVARPAVGRLAREVVDACAVPACAPVQSFGEPATPVFLFGAGHVGRALVLALANLPFRVTWIEERREAFPAAMPGNVTPVQSVDAPAELASAPEGCFVLAMTHSHELDFRIVATALQSRRIAFVGLIGSKTKRARFISRLSKLGIEDVERRLVCPIGLPHVDSKLPAVIAAVTVSQLLALRCAPKALSDEDMTETSHAVI